VNAIGGRLNFAGTQELVDQSLRGITSSSSKFGLIRIGRDRVWVVGEQVPEVKSEGSWLFDGDRS
jgi:hypothetical protein